MSENSQYVTQFYYQDLMKRNPTFAQDFLTIANRTEDVSSIYSAYLSFAQQNSAKTEPPQASGGTITNAPGTIGAGTIAPVTNPVSGGNVNTALLDFFIDPNMLLMLVMLQGRRDMNDIIMMMMLMNSTKDTSKHSNPFDWFGNIFGSSGSGSSSGITRGWNIIN